MTPRKRTTSKKPSTARHRYLRPGELARIRDSIISARSRKLKNAQDQIFLAAFPRRPPSPPPSPQPPATPPPSPQSTPALLPTPQPTTPPPPTPQPTNAPPQEACPCFQERILGPRFPQRKRIMAPESVSYITYTPPHSPPGSSNSVIDSN